MANTRERVPAHTKAEINRRIQQEISNRVYYYSEHKSEISRRLKELDEEWDIERAIEANAAAIGFVGVALGATRDRRWLLLPALVTGFLFQHAMQGWCPPIPMLRRLGFRTAHEIEHERQALKALRGDYDKVVHAHDQAGTALSAAGA